VGTIIEIPKELQDALALYLRFHPTWKKKDAVPLLVKDAKGTPFNHVNDLTKILNSIFGKRVGSTMLRHSYLSSKYGKMREEQKNDSKMMGHSTEVQQTYIKKLI
jgi:integrase